MSDHLPEDPTRWPHAPHEVLAVPPDIGRKELRSAYVRLIRHYKPELFPEQFRRIRAAYESMLQFIEWSDQTDPPNGGGTYTPADVSPQQNVGEPAGAPRMFAGLDRFATHPGLPEELDRLWQQAYEGRAAEAYAKLIRLDEQHPQHEAVCLRGYWLLRAMPQLDRQREPRDWLARGLRAGHGRGPLVELYRRELEQDSAESSGRRFSEVANVELSVPQLVALTEFRWLTAARARRWSVIKEDLATLRPQLVDMPQWWARLLYEACGHLAWERTDEPGGMFLLCCREIKQRYDPLQPWSGALDQLDFLVELAGEWRRLCNLGDAPSDVCYLVPICWSRPAWEVKAELDPFIARVARNSEAGLEVLDFLARHTPKVLAQLGSRLLDLMRWEAVEFNSEEPTELHAAVVGDFLTEYAGGGTYGWLRPHLLNFCLLEDVPPNQLAALAQQHRLTAITTDGANLADCLFQDEPIRFVYFAYQLFWK